MSDQIVFIEGEDIVSVVSSSDDLVVIETPDAFFVSSGEQGPAGPQGLQGPAGGAGVSPIGFAYGDATPALLLNVPADKSIFEIRIVITEEFDGIGAALTVGTLVDPDSLVVAEENDPSLAATYVTTLDVEYVAQTAIYLTITPGAGASQGRGQIIFITEN